MDAEAFNLFGISVMWYGVLIATGMVLAFIYALTRAKIENIKSDDIYDLGIFAIIFGVIGARLYYVIFEFKTFISYSIGATLRNIIDIRNGGLAIYGGILAGFLTVLVVSKIKKIRFSTLLDVVSPAVMIGQIIGRWGNFINVEAFGGETSLPWRMGILSSFDGGESFYSEMFVHPTFLYESLWNLLGFILIHVFYKKKKFNGQVFLFYMTWYGFGRMLIEGLRTDSLMLGPVRVSQALAAATFILGAVLMIINLRNLKRYNEAVSVEEKKEEIIE
ncbi:MAG: prolipoprotein diacylglyceryl transferase [Ruminococcaceae bacterium]|nr:prolipoprotein diacylglyceryl transferase [Oscillospiraceae bacterium]